MNREPKLRYYKVDGAGLEFMKAYRDELEATLDDRDKLEAEYAERAQQQAAYHQAKLRALWRRLSASVGLDPNETWGSAEYQIETRYLDDGFGAVLYVPRQVNSLQEMLGSEPVTKSDDPAMEIPSKDTTRH